MKRILWLLTITVVVLNGFCVYVEAKKINGLGPKKTVQYNETEHTVQADIQFTTPVDSSAGAEIPVTMKITPQEDIRADISCLLPKGVMPVPGKGVHIMPYYQRGIPNMDRQKQYRFSAGLFRGLLKAGETKEFTFSIKAPQKGSYNLLGVVNSMPNWEEKDAVLTVNVN
jgi:hypothetical protein